MKLFFAKTLNTQDFFSIAAIGLNTAAEVTEFLENNEVAVIGFFKDQESKLAKDYLKAVKDYEEYPCAITSNEEAIKNNEVRSKQFVWSF